MLPEKLLRDPRKSASAGSSERISVGIESRVRDRTVIESEVMFNRGKLLQKV